jgi:hypothetical protein
MHETQHTTMLPFNCFRKYISKIPTRPDNCSMVPVPCFWGHVRHIFAFFFFIIVCAYSVFVSACFVPLLFRIQITSLRACSVVVVYSDRLLACSLVGMIYSLSRTFQYFCFLVYS